MSFISVAAGQPIRATHVQQFTNWLTGLKLDTPGTVACTSTTEYALTVRSQDGTTGLALNVQYGSSGAPTTLAYFTKDETRLSSNDGGDYLQVTNTGVNVSGTFTVNGTSVGGSFANPYTSAPLLLGAGTATAPSLASVGNTNTGLFWPAASQVALQASGVQLLLNGASGASQRAVLYDTAHTGEMLQLSRGSGVSAGVVPGSSTSAALQVTSYQSGGTSAAQGEAIKGAAYAASGTGGGFIGVSGIAEAPAASNWVSSGASTLIGLFGSAYSYRTSGRVWGANVIARGATAAQGDLTGIEVGVEAMSAVQNRYGVQIVTLANGANRGSSEDIGLKFADKTNPTTAANLWNVGIGFASPGIGTGSTGFPVSSTGTLIKAFGGATVADGVDFSTLTFTGSPLKLPNLVVNQTGRIAIRTTAVDGTAPIRVNCQDDTRLMVLDNSGGIVQTSVGATGAAVTMPNRPSGYLLFTLGGSAACIPYFAAS